MQDDKNEKNEDVKTDLKHDTMDFVEPLDGEGEVEDDSLDFEEDEITADELEVIEGEPDDEEAAALNEAETEIAMDEDTMPDEDWTDDLPDTDVEDDGDDMDR